MKTRDQLLKQFLKTGLTLDRQRFTSMRNKVTRSLRQAKANFFINIIERAKGNGKIIWQHLNKLLGRHSNKSKNTIELYVNNSIVREPLSIASNLNTFFISSVKEISQSFDSVVCSDNVNDVGQNLFTITHISDTEVAKLITGLKQSKALDVYGINTNFLKEHMDLLVRPTTHVLNMSFEHSIVPTDWKIAAVTPIFKAGVKTDMANYRPISILPVISKIAEKWVVKLLTAHLENTQPSLHPLQFGFRAHHSIDAALCMLVENLKSLLDKSPCIGAVFLDLKKAFDSVNHQILLSRLTQFNISSQALQWFASYLSHRKQCVVLDGVKSPYLDCDTGVPQGSFLGPLLFSLFINNLPEVCPNIFAQMYADDAVIYTQANSVQQVAKDLTAALALMHSWLEDSCLMLNTSKTVCMYFSKRPLNLKQSNIFLDGVELELAPELKYLGVILDPTLSFKSHINKVSQVLKFNNRNFNHIRNNLNMNVAKTYFYSMIISHMDYCLTSWSLACPTTLKTIENIYKRSLKLLDKKPTSPPLSCVKKT
uniref:Reverse transcriptase domain-containing protein n=1 Tax=Oreochromis niloticus TaxID=8128 RepID=A0A669CUH2_ORENI